jgi:hypothetical protein
VPVEDEDVAVAVGVFGDEVVGVGFERNIRILCPIALVGQSVTRARVHDRNCA